MSEFILNKDDERLIKHAIREGTLGFDNYENRSFARWGATEAEHLEATKNWFLKVARIMETRIKKAPKDRVDPIGPAGSGGLVSVK